MRRVFLRDFKQLSLSYYLEKNIKQLFDTCPHSSMIEIIPNLYVHNSFNYCIINYLVNSDTKIEIKPIEMKINNKRLKVLNNAIFHVDRKTSTRIQITSVTLKHVYDIIKHINSYCDKLSCNGK